jgi:acetyltransferase-like isoleucine patch superfamily enzyme
MSLSQKIKSNAALKRLTLTLLMPRGQARPRAWVRLFVNPFYHKKGRGALIRRRSRIDVLPFNAFVLGDYSTIEDFCTINNGVGEVIIGSETRIGMGNVLIGPVSVGNNVILAQHVVVSGLNHNYEDIGVPVRKQGITAKRITIGDDCWIGANTVITAGVTIGKHCVVAGGSVVTKDIPPYSVAAGNPARVIKQYDAAQQVWVKVPRPI